MSYIHIRLYSFAIHMHSYEFQYGLVRIISYLLNDIQGFFSLIKINLQVAKDN